jgi:hypothetical protein
MCMRCRTRMAKPEIVNVALASGPHHIFFNNSLESAVCHHGTDPGDKVLAANVDTINNQSRAYEVRSHFAWSTAKANNTDAKESQIGMVDRGVFARGSKSWGVCVADLTLQQSERTRALKSPIAAARIWCRQAPSPMLTRARRLRISILS